MLDDFIKIRLFQNIGGGGRQCGFVLLIFLLTELEEELKTVGEADYLQKELLVQFQVDFLDGKTEKFEIVDGGGLFGLLQVQGKENRGAFIIIWKDRENNDGVGRMIDLVVHLKVANGEGIVESVGCILVYEVYLANSDVHQLHGRGINHANADAMHKEPENAVILLHVELCVGKIGG